MSMLVTGLVLLAITALAAWWHVRHSAPSSESAATQACPRCAAHMPLGVTNCPSCHVPLQAYDLVMAPVVSGGGPSDSGAKPHPVVRTDVCVGCGTCVAACPEQGAIRIVDHRAQVNLDICQRHGSCAPACPVGALVMASGEAVQRLEVPELDGNFQSNVPGLYVVGELGGRGLIKNAINEGRIAIEHVAQTLALRRDEAGTGLAAGPRGAEPYDAIIVGSGPAGLSAALEAKRLGLRAVVLEQGSLSDTIRKYPRRKLLLAEPTRVQNYGGLWVSDASKEELLRIWEDTVTRSALSELTGQRVEAVEPVGGILSVRTSASEYSGRAVILAMGRRGTPRVLGVAGESLEKTLYNIVEMEAFAGCRMLVVGGGDTAIESALGLANQTGTAVTLSYRGREFQRPAERNRVKLEAALAAGKVELLLESRVLEIRPDVVALECPAGPRLVPNDFVVIRIGGDPPYPFLERCGVRIVTKEVAIDTKAAELAAG